MIKLDKISYGYNENEAKMEINNVDLKIDKGEFILLCGESGCGKTTITRMINGLIPHYFEGVLKGSISVKNTNIVETELYNIAKIVGSVFQNPRSSFFNVDTNSELTFGCENLGYDEDEIFSRMKNTVKEFNIENLMDRSIFSLSGGEKQKIACASINMLIPDIIVLDEPSSNLDFKSIDDLRKILGNWKNQGKTIIIAEHRLYYLEKLASRIIYFKNGEVNRDLSPKEFKEISEENRKNMGLRTLSLNELKFEERDSFKERKKIILEDFHFCYDKNKKILEIEKDEIPLGETIAIIGSNGAGKSTLARCICGLEKNIGMMIKEGKYYDSKERLKLSYMVMQDTSHQLFTESVLDEILLSMEDEKEQSAEKILKEYDLYKLRDRHPASLSGGQKQRVAIASAVAANKELIILDEPTSGLDYRHMVEVAEGLKKIKTMGKTSIVITHDLELILSCCTYILYMEEGKIMDKYYLDKDGMKKIVKFFKSV